MAIKVRVQNFQSIEDAEIVIDGFTVVTGTNNAGKALKNGTLVATPKGWRPVEDLIVGDSVIAGDGTPTKVTGVFPQGVRKTWDITFDDGRQISVDADHLWKISIGSSRFYRYGDKTQRWEVLTTQVVFDRVGSSPKGVMRPAIPAALPAQYDHTVVPIDPYLLGALLGDGSLIGSTLRFSSVDHGVLEGVTQGLPPNLTLTRDRQSANYRISGRKGKPNPLTIACKQLGLLGHRSSEKFVPDCYKYNSQEVRVALLQGLMDTDGSVDKRGGVYFYTSSKQLADDVSELVWSLGGKSRCGVKVPFYTCRGERRRGLHCYTLCIRLPAIQLFRLPRKLNRIKRAVRKNNPLMVKLTSGEETYCTCISIAHPDHLFQVKGHLVTHNSALFRAIRGAFTNTRGSDFVRLGKTHCTVDLEFEDGKTLRWEKGQGINDYVINGKVFKKVDRGVPPEIRIFGVVPVEVSDAKLWPQIAPQISGISFLLDQPGSVIAEAVADVGRVNQLTRALKSSESDRRSAKNDLKIRLQDGKNLAERRETFTGLDEAVESLVGIEGRCEMGERMLKAVSALDRFRVRLQTARQVLEEMAGLAVVEQSIPAESRVVELGELALRCSELRQVHTRYGEACLAVNALEGIGRVEEAIPSEARIDHAQKFRGVIGVTVDLVLKWDDAKNGLAKAQNAHTVLAGVSLDDSVVERAQRFTKGLANTRRRLEGIRKARLECSELERAVHHGEAELAELNSQMGALLGSFSECPTCGGDLDHVH